MIMEAKGVTLRAGGGVFPVWDVDIGVKKNDRLAIVGESGGGKTSLAWALTGRVLPGQALVSGEVLYRESRLYGLPYADRSRLYYRSIALMPQNAQDAFHPAQPLWKSAREVIAKNGVARPDFSAVRDRVAPLSHAVDLRPEHWRRYPHQLSGGQKQRMALVLALINGPELLLLDEPTNALDELTREKVTEHLNDWLKGARTGMVLFTHDLGMAARFASRIAVLYRGEIVEEFPAEEIDRPLHPYTKGLLESAIRFGDLPLSRIGIPGYALPLSHPPASCSFRQRCTKAGDPCGKAHPRLEERGEKKVRCFMV